jgi:hypothetical protein
VPQENQHSEHFNAVDEKLNQYTESLKPLKKNKNFSYSLGEKLNKRPFSLCAAVLGAVLYPIGTTYHIFGLMITGIMPYVFGTGLFIILSLKLMLTRNESKARQYDRDSTKTKAWMCLPFLIICCAYPLCGGPMPAFDLSLNPILHSNAFNYILMLSSLLYIIPIALIVYQKISEKQNKNKEAACSTKANTSRIELERVLEDAKTKNRKLPADILRRLFEERVDEKHNDYRATTPFTEFAMLCERYFDQNKEGNPSICKSLVDESFLSGIKKNKAFLDQKNYLINLLGEHATHYLLSKSGTTEYEFSQLQQKFFNEQEHVLQSNTTASVNRFLDRGTFENRSVGVIAVSLRNKLRHYYFNDRWKNTSLNEDPCNQSRSLSDSFFVQNIVRLIALLKLAEINIDALYWANQQKESPCPFLEQQYKKWEKFSSSHVIDTLYTNHSPVTIKELMQKLSGDYYPQLTGMVNASDEFFTKETKQIFIELSKTIRTIGEDNKNILKDCIAYGYKNYHDSYEEARRKSEAEAAEDRRRYAEEQRNARPQYRQTNVTQSDYYAVLGVPRTATSVEIIKAYRKLVILYHPDKFKGTEEEKEASKLTSNKEFKEHVQLINAAYETLSDTLSKSTYNVENPLAGLTQRTIQATNTKAEALKTARKAAHKETTKSEVAKKEKAQKEAEKRNQMAREKSRAQEAAAARQEGGGAAAAVPIPACPPVLHNPSSTERSDKDQQGQTIKIGC